MLLVRISKQYSPMSLFPGSLSSVSPANAELSAFQLSMTHLISNEAVDWKPSRGDVRDWANTAASSLLQWTHTGAGIINHMVRNCENSGQLGFSTVVTSETGKVTSDSGRKGRWNIFRRKQATYIRPQHSYRIPGRLSFSHFAASKDEEIAEPTSDSNQLRRSLCSRMTLNLALRRPYSGNSR